MEDVGNEVKEFCGDTKDTAIKTGVKIDKVEWYISWVEKAGLVKNIGCHTLRHCFATYYFALISSRAGTYAKDRTIWTVRGSLWRLVW